ncbi:hypothetical protein HH303_00400 [Rhodospirillaceae bacterium KN72]|uniref:Uncharacterized protein n=1 Tax=Pacificispira spongiicola TaxID=2729598 RepID=A0A7Y0DWJ4_9PROT|nr:hypothetical protein [Pacificispira spongiicola]NMM42917.1 hypothetical protein [Pacificispira spongiicola]
MDFVKRDPPRRFTVGAAGQIELSDCGTVRLDADEQVTFHSVSGGTETAFDVTRKSFGYYASNSLNGTLPRQGLRPALCRNEAHGLLYMLFVEKGKEADYAAYLDAEGMVHLGWLDAINAMRFPAQKP